MSQQVFCRKSERNHGVGIFTVAAGRIDCFRPLFGISPTEIEPGQHHADDDRGERYRQHEAHGMQLDAGAGFIGAQRGGRRLPVCIRGMGLYIRPIPLYKGS